MRTRMASVSISRALAPTTIWMDAVLVVGFSILTAVAAQIAFYLPFTPVPITGQTMAVLLAGVILGSRRGALSQIAYIGQGLIGLPVFAGGHFGPAYVFGPTAGYLVGFVVAAFLTGLLAERGFNHHPIKLVAAMLVGMAAYSGFGALWLSVFVGTDLAVVAASGVLPFVPGDLLKIALAGAAVPVAWKLFNR